MNATFTIHIELGNAAMQTQFDIADALRSVADKLDGCVVWNGIVRDSNGNTVGHFETKDAA